MLYRTVRLLSLTTLMFSCGEAFLPSPPWKQTILQKRSDTDGKQLPFVHQDCLLCRGCSSLPSSFSRGVMFSAVGNSGDNIAAPPSKINGGTINERSSSSSSTTADLQKRVSTDAGGWKEKLLKASNLASMLCVLDCTVLPLVTLVLPLFGVVAASPAQMEWLHELGHRVALFFVMPVGGLATTMNYSNHRKRWIASLGYLGLLVVLVANVGCRWAHDLPGPLGHVLDRYLHMFGHGVVHRVTNLVGCGLLLFSNFMSYRLGGCKDESCAHHHHEH